jgi:hypothetical protein
LNPKHGEFETLKGKILRRQPDRGWAHILDDPFFG